MLNKHYLGLIKKYSFIDDAKIVGGDFILYYKDKSKKLPLRASVSHLQKTLQKIKKEVGVKNEEKNEDKGISICAF